MRNSDVLLRASHATQAMRSRARLSIAAGVMHALPQKSPCRKSGSSSLGKHPKLLVFANSNHNPEWLRSRTW